MGPTKSYTLQLWPSLTPSSLGLSLREKGQVRTGVREAEEAPVHRKKKKKNKFYIDEAVSPIPIVKTEKPRHSEREKGSSSKPYAELERKPSLERWLVVAKLGLAPDT